MFTATKVSKSGWEPTFSSLEDVVGSGVVAGEGVEHVDRAGTVVAGEGVEHVDKAGTVVGGEGVEHVDRAGAAVLCVPKLTLYTLGHHSLCLGMDKIAQLGYL